MKNLVKMTEKRYNFMFGVRCVVGSDRVVAPRTVCAVVDVPVSATSA